MRSVSSVLAVSTKRSAKQFARGHRGGIAGYRWHRCGPEDVDPFERDRAVDVVDSPPAASGALWEKASRRRGVSWRRSTASCSRDQIAKET